ncbi:MAG: hypothetical protein Q9183_003669 [Haloplaca sp. 2 TL-2023]
MRRITRQLLSALDFLHDDCGIVHTDLKQANILLDLNGPYLEHEQRELCVQEELWHVPTATGIAYPEFDYVKSDYLLSSLTDVDKINIQLADLGSGMALYSNCSSAEAKALIACWKDKHISEIIQPPLLRAPEVTLGLPWDEKVDIWIAGHLVYESLTARMMFGGVNPRDTLTQMALLLGPFPKGLMERVEEGNVLFTPDGKLPWRAALPLVRCHIDVAKVADENHFVGYMKHADTYPPQTLEKALQGSPERPEYESPLSHEERKDFLAFVRLMLELDPRERPSAKELLNHPWLHKEYEHPEYESF